MVCPDVFASLPVQTAYIRIELVHLAIVHCIQFHADFGERGKKREKVSVYNEGIGVPSVQQPSMLVLRPHPSIARSGI